MSDGSTRRRQDQRRVSPDKSGRMASPDGPYASSRMPIPRPDGSGRSANPYRQYDPQNPNTSSRMPTLGSATVYGAVYGKQSEVWTSARLEAAVAHKHRLGLTIFHDGNPGHLWRGEIASRFGEVLLSVGMVIWLAATLQSAMAVAVALIALGLPFLLVGPFGAGLENASRPGTALKWLNSLRLVLVLGLAGLFFHFVAPAVFALLFLLSLCGRLHDAARIGAMRSCLAPGEPEHVANDIYTGEVLASVLGPILATLLYVLAGERIIAVDVVVAAAFLVSGNSEGLLDALPEERRAFLLATPETLYPGGEVPALAHTPEEADLLEDEEWREEALPVWYQQGPSSVGQAFGEVGSGLGLAGSSPSASLALWSVGGLALAGAAFATLAVFYITGELGLPIFYLGPFAAAEGAGVALGALAVMSDVTKAWRLQLWFGMAATGFFFLALAILPLLLIDLGLALLTGLMTALAVSAARRALYRDFDPVEQRAISAAESAVAALGAVIGTLLVGLFLQGTKPLAGAPKLPGWSASELLVLLGFGLVVGALLLLVMPSGKSGRNGASRSRLDRIGASREMGAIGDEFDSSYAGAAADDDGGWGAALDETEEAEGDGWDARQYGGAGNDAEYYTGYGTSYDAVPGSDDQGPSARPGRPGNTRRPRW